MKVKDVVEYNRVITVPESQELYSRKLNEILQREYDKKRIEKIKNYILTMPERFFSSLVVAIHKGDPIWSDFDLETHFRVENEILDDESFEFIENKLGVLTLSGSEEIFVLDGQHRLLGLRSAYETNQEIGNDEIALLFIVHSEKLKERTRRLFTVLNRYAVKIKPAEQIILEEDDAAAILTRRLVENYEIFGKEKALSTTAKSEKKDLNKGFNLPTTDVTSFTTLVCLNKISEVVVNSKDLYKGGVIKRPSDDTLDNLWLDLKSYWDEFFEMFPYISSFIKGEQVPEDIRRNHDSGGTVLLRPEGQLLFAQVYKKYKDDGQLQFFKINAPKIDFNLNGPIWRYVFWIGSTIETKNKRLKKSLFFYLLGDLSKKHAVESELTKVYKDHGLEYDKHIKPVTT
ncbi:hypothetical protein GCM10028817_28990 [Spirosoma pomorum]